MLLSDCLFHQKWYDLMLKLYLLHIRFWTCVSDEGGSRHKWVCNELCPCQWRSDKSCYRKLDFSDFLHQVSPLYKSLEVTKPYFREKISWINFGYCGLNLIQIRVFMQSRVRIIRFYNVAPSPTTQPTPVIIISKIGPKPEKTSRAILWNTRNIFNTKIQIFHTNFENT